MYFVLVSLLTYIDYLLSVFAFVCRCFVGSCDILAWFFFISWGVSVCVSVLCWRAGFRKGQFGFILF